MLSTNLRARLINIQARLKELAERGVAIARHPAVIGFILTGIFATTFSKWLDHMSQEREAHATANLRATQSIKDLSDLVSERRERGTLLSSAINRGARGSEIAARKFAYDEAYVRWNANYQSNLFRLRYIAGSIWSAYEQSVENKLVPLLRGADSCLTAAYDTYERQMRRLIPTPIRPQKKSLTPASLRMITESLSTSQ